MLFPFEREIGDRDTFVFQGRDHLFCLSGRDNFVLQALEEDYGAGKLLGVVQRRALLVEILALWVGAYQPVRVPRFEFVGILCQGRQIADAVIAGPRLEELMKSERAEGGVAACAAAADGQPLAVYQTAFYQIASAVYAIVHIHHAPLPI